MQELYEKMGLFYLGKDADGLELYKSKHLTTHAMIIGMTGSGKTGLGIGLIEEAAIDNIPAIVIDPKGDMANLCLNFTNLDAKEFKPWIDENEAATKGISVDELAAQKAKMWQEGINRDYQSKERIVKLANVEKCIYTPGSSAGVGVNVLGSFDAPSQEVLDDGDTLSALINATVSSILSLISIEADPISSKEHLLLSNIFYHCYSKGESLSLEQLIGYVAAPPFEKIGVFSLATFYPQAQRMKLAMLLNGIISSPSFSKWIEGDGLDIEKMLFDERGKAKIAIFSIAHLNDNERMFFVTILLNSYIAWMRRQSGSSRLRAMLYMDEIFGFFPPTKNPPSKEPMLLLLKQARAFGIGVVLSTQNPVDIDYKALGNIGTWFVGKLQTKQDIARVIEGLASKSNLSKEEISSRLKTLKGREFFLQNVHTNLTSSFFTRWVLSYLKGPMTKDDIKFLMREKKEQLHKSTMKEKQSPSLESSTTSNSRKNTGMKPIVSENIKEYYNNTNMNAKEPFVPYIYASAEVRLFNQKRGVDVTESYYFKVMLHEEDEDVCFQNNNIAGAINFTLKPKTDAQYEALPSFFTKFKNLKPIEKRLSNYLYNSSAVEIFEQKKLKLVSEVHESKEQFIRKVEDNLAELKEEALEKLERKYEIKFERLDDKVEKLYAKLEKEQSDVSSKTSDTFIDIGLAVIGAFFGKKKVTSTTLRRGASAFKKSKGVLKERNDVKNVEALIEDAQSDIEKLKEYFEEDVNKLNEKYAIENFPVSSYFVKPRRADTTVKEIALLWER
jgi:hypothetical protein